MNIMEKVAIESLFEVMQDIKRLLILQALSSGCQQKHIAAALNISEATLSRMFPKGFAKEISRIGIHSGGAKGRAHG